MHGVWWRSTSTFPNCSWGLAAVCSPPLACSGAHGSWRDLSSSFASYVLSCSGILVRVFCATLARKHVVLVGRVRVYHELARPFVVLILFTACGLIRIARRLGPDATPGARTGAGDPSWWGISVCGVCKYGNFFWKTSLCRLRRVPGWQVGTPGIMISDAAAISFLHHSRSMRLCVWMCIIERIRSVTARGMTRFLYLFPLAVVRADSASGRFSSQLAGAGCVRCWRISRPWLGRHDRCPVCKSCVTSRSRSQANVNYFSAPIRSDFRSHPCCKVCGVSGLRLYAIFGLFGLWLIGCARYSSFLCSREFFKCTRHARSITEFWLARCAVTLYKGSRDYGFSAAGNGRR